MIAFGVFCRKIKKKTRFFFVGLIYFVNLDYCYSINKNINDYELFAI